MDWWPTFVKVAGGDSPSRVWKNNKGKNTIFDSLVNLDYLLGQGPSKRDHFYYVNDLIATQEGINFEIKAEGFTISIP